MRHSTVWPHVSSTSWRTFSNLFHQSFSLTNLEILSSLSSNWSVRIPSSKLLTSTKSSSLSIWWPVEEKRVSWVILWGAVWSTGCKKSLYRGSKISKRSKWCSTTMSVLRRWRRSRLLVNLWTSTLLTAGSKRRSGVLLSISRLSFGSSRKGSH